MQRAPSPAPLSSLGTTQLFASRTVQILLPLLWVIYDKHHVHAQRQPSVRALELKKHIQSIIRVGLTHRLRGIASHCTGTRGCIKFSSTAALSFGLRHRLVINVFLFCFPLTSVLGFDVSGFLGTNVVALMFTPTTLLDIVLLELFSFSVCITWMIINHNLVIYSLSLPLTFIYHTFTLFESTERIFSPKYSRAATYGRKRTVTVPSEAYLDLVQPTILWPYLCTVVLLTVVTVYGTVTSPSLDVYGGRKILERSSHDAGQNCHLSHLCGERGF
jgi:hypothetical protein